MSGLKILGVLIGLCVLAAGCASSPDYSSPSDIQVSYKPDRAAIGQMLKEEVGDLDNHLVQKILTEAPPKKAKNRRHGQSEVQAQLENEMQRQIWWWMRYYTIRERDLFTRALNRGEVYRPLVQQILREHHLPPELYYLAMIESGYVTGNTSSASAVGIWQFMRPTALHYKLAVSGAIDERRHPIAATHAAARYLSDLHKQFRSWYLAIAAYNAGQGRIARAVKRGHTTDFWSLAERKLIPRETMDYIPKFLAAASIGQHQDMFGFEVQSSSWQWPEIAAVDLKVRDLRNFKAGKREQDLARIAGLSVLELRRYNPQLRQALARRDVRKIRVWMPKDSANRFALPKTLVAEAGNKPPKKRKI
jgi:membrane-bound lytic murein transglycosylase D